MNDLIRLYMQGFSEDGENFARLFCSRNAAYSYRFPDTDPHSAGYLLPRRTTIGEIGYVSAVSTEKESRGNGYAAEVMKAIVADGVEKYKYPFLALSPALADYYKRFGFFTVERFGYDIVVGGEDVFVREAAPDDIYSISRLLPSGSLYRIFDEDYYKQTKEDCMGVGKALVFERGGKIAAFAIKFENLLTGVVDPFDLITKCERLKGCRLESKQKTDLPFTQIRIGDFGAFCAILKPKISFGIVVEINDSIARDNNGIWHITATDGAISAQKIFDDSVVAERVDINNAYEYLVKNGFVHELKIFFQDRY